MQIHHGIEQLSLLRPVVTIGSFDGVHRGHVQVIRSLNAFAAETGGESAILSFDPHPREVLYPLEKRPGILTTLPEKAALLTGYGVDHLVLLHFTRELADMNYADFIRRILVDKIGLKGWVVGYDHRFGKNREGNFDAVQELAGRYDFSIRREDACTAGDVQISSTKIRTALERGEISLANEMLGYDYPLSGTVVHGDQLGRRIGFPTANLQTDDERKQLPALGVYAVKAVVDGVEYKGLLNIGVRPTVCYSGEIRPEVHLLDFAGSLYGKQLVVRLVSRLRQEQRFAGLDDLSRQLAKDEQQARSWFARNGAV
ncbi:MAG: bifunctional riboflavin kinase/FAD synthetase [Culturomica sp.]|jgi:riboflavin kinase/FMN adenylyltransferase|nr:bifunctional riboflavin kinase/FAD synthetase [Culturomica sp.]